MHIAQSFPMSNISLLEQDNGKSVNREQQCWDCSTGDRNHDAICHSIMIALDLVHSIGISVAQFEIPSTIIRRELRVVGDIKASLVTCLVIHDSLLQWFTVPLNRTVTCINRDHSFSTTLPHFF
jgi:hypothetical protein